MSFFASPLLEQRFPNAQHDRTQAIASLEYLLDHPDEVLASYPKFEGFHKPGFFQGRVFVADEAPSLESIQKLCQSGSPREIGFAQWQGKWLIMVGGTSESFQFPPELRRIVPLMGHTHPADPDALVSYPSFKDLNLLKDEPEYIFSPSGVVRYGPIKPEFVEQGKSLASYKDNPAQAKFFMYRNRHGITSDKFAADRESVFYGFLQEVYGAERATWHEREKLDALLGGRMPRDGAQRSV